MKRMANTLHRFILKLFIKAHKTQDVQLKRLNLSTELKASTIDGLCRKLKYDMSALKKLTDPAQCLDDISQRSGGRRSE